MAGYAECGGGCTGYLPCISGSVVSSCIITYIIGVIGFCGMAINIVLQVVSIVDFLMVAIGIVLAKPCVHLSHKGIPVHTVTVKDRFIHFLFYIP